MRDYAELVKALRCCSKIDARNNGCDSCHYEYCGDDCQNLCGYAADAIEELLAFTKFVAREAIDTGDNDGVSAEILCRKLNKLGLIETDGEFWMLPTPPKEVE